jgi:arylsulfatase A-like enzyme
MSGGRDENLGAWPRTEAMIRDQLAEYYAMMAHLDAQIGRLFAALERTGRAKDTLIVYAADNGLALGSHGLLGKQNVFEHSMRVPLILAGPGIPRGGESGAFTYLFDLFPTLCDLAGVPAPSGLAGFSLRPVWEGRRERVRESVFLPYLEVQRAVRDERWKLICYPKLGFSQLFDLETDPHETRSVYDNPAHAAHVTRLRGLMREWQQRVGDKVALPEGQRLPPPIDLTGKPRKTDQWQPEWIVKKYF